MLRLLLTIILFAALTSQMAGVAGNEYMSEAQSTIEVEDNTQEEVFEVTAYTNAECDKDESDPNYGRTASGKFAEYGTISAPAHIPFGTRFYIEGYGIGVVMDRGGAIRGNILDVWMPSRGEALRWGRREVKVIRLED